MEDDSFKSNSTAVSAATTTEGGGGPPPPKNWEKAIRMRVDFVGTGSAYTAYKADMEATKQANAPENTIKVEVKRSK